MLYLVPLTQMTQFGVEMNLIWVPVNPAALQEFPYVCEWHNFE